MVSGKFAIGHQELERLGQRLQLINDQEKRVKKRLEIDSHDYSTMIDNEIRRGIILGYRRRYVIGGRSKTEGTWNWGFQEEPRRSM